MFPTFRNWYRNLTMAPADVDVSVYTTILRISRPLGWLLLMSAISLLATIVLYVATAVVFVVGSGDGTPKGQPVVLSMLEWAIPIIWWVGAAAFVIWTALQGVLLVRFRSLLTKGQRIRALMATIAAVIVVAYVLLAAMIVLLMGIHNLATIH